MTVPPLTGLRVIDLSSGIAGAYAGKLLADAGADVTKAETPQGDPLRRWSASGAAIPADRDGALFNYLSAGKRSVVTEAASVQDLIGAADAVVWSRGSTLAEDPLLAPDAILRRHPHIRLAAITPFGLTGPWSDRPATEFTLQAWSGAVIGLGRGSPDRAPVHVGGQVGEWVAGTYAALGLLTSLRRGGSAGEVIDLSMLEALMTSLTYHPVTFHDQLGRPMRKKRAQPTPGVAESQDGLVGLGVGTGQQWLDFCSLVGHAEWTENPRYFMDRTALGPVIDAWVAERPSAEVLELATAFRLPNAPIVNGENACGFEHFRQRQTFRPNASDGAANPGPAYRLSSAPLRAPQPAPRLGEHTATADEPRASQGKATGHLPFSGLRVLDMTAYWAGPLVGHYLAQLGAEVIHLESAARPDGARLIGGVPPTEESYWERGPIFAALNSNKKSLALDLGSERGRAILRQVVATCDVVVENYTPRVLEQLGLDYEALRSERSDLIMVRMPGFGLDGPWRDLAAFAFVIEDASGLTWLTGHPDQLPIEPYCIGDPNAGLHALFGLLVALAHRERTGEGALVEAAMVDAALSITAEQVIEHSAYGALLTRSGNSGPAAAPQNLYRAAGLDEYGREDSWVAIAVATDEQWAGLCGAVGLAASLDRFAERDGIDAHLERWCLERSAEDIVGLLWDAGVPVGKVMQPHRQPDLAQLASRTFFEEVEHPVTATSRLSTLPMTFSRGPDRVHLRHAPLLGEHNAELLRGLGLSAAEIEALEADGVIGRSVPVAGAS